MSETKTYRGRGLDEILAQIREELGPDAVIVARRENAEGGVGGFFARRVIEVDARQPDAGGAPGAPGSSVDVVADERAEPDLPGAAVPAPSAAATGGLSLPEALAEAEPTFEEHLKALLGVGGETPPAAPAVAPVVVPEVPEVPAPPPAAPLSDLARAYAEAGRVEEPAPVSPAAEPEPEPVAIEPEPELEPEPVVIEPRAEPVAAEPEIEPEPEIVEPAADEPEAEIVEPEPEPDEPEILEPVASAVAPVTFDDAAARARDALVEAGLGVALATSVVEETVTHLAPFAQDPALEPLVHRALANRIPIHVARGAGGKVVGFVGPGGAGKTRCAARLAAAYDARSPLPVAVVTLRPEDGGAELRTLLHGTGVEIHVEHDAAQAARRIEALRDSTLVVLDTPGVSPMAEAELRVLAAELAQVRADELHLTVPATYSHRAARELIAGARPLGACAIAITHTDETEALGTVVDAAVETATPLSFVGRGHGVQSGLRPADAGELALALMH